MEFTPPPDNEWLGEALVHDHGYLPPEGSAYPPFRQEDDVIHIELRRPDGTPVDESDRAAIQAIIDAHDGSPPADIAAEQKPREDARAIIESHNTKARQVIAGEGGVSFTASELNKLIAALAEVT